MYTHTTQCITPSFPPSRFNTDAVLFWCIQRVLQRGSKGCVWTLWEASLTPPLLPFGVVRAYCTSCNPMHVTSQPDHVTCDCHVTSSDSSTWSCDMWLSCDLMWYLKPDCVACDCHVTPLISCDVMWLPPKDHNAVHKVPPTGHCMSHVGPFLSRWGVLPVQNSPW